MNNIQENLHGMSRFGVFDHNIIEKCQWDYIEGNDLNRTLAGIDEKKIRQIISETYNADQLFKTKNPEVLFSAHLSRLDDWSLAVLGEIMFQFQAQFQPDPSKAEVANMCDKQGWQAWEQILTSPHISPCISYDLVYMEVANKMRFEQDKRAIEIIKDSLAFAIKQCITMNAFNMIRDLGDIYISFSEIEPGIEIYAELLLANPKDIWNYNAMALSLDTDVTAGIGLQIARRGLKLIKTTGDQMGLAAQLKDIAKELEKTTARQAITHEEINPAVLQKLETALTIDFDAGYAVDLPELCRKVVPDLDSRVVKQYPTKIDLPSKEQVKRNLADPLSLPAEKKQTVKTQPQKVNVQQSAVKPGRNDPCPCGSGKKYKKCCLK